jgi:hypothetical protein
MPVSLTYSFKTQNELTLKFKFEKYVTKLKGKLNTTLSRSNPLTTTKTRKQ